jgi:hypothetical protein
VVTIFIKSPAVMGVFVWANEKDVAPRKRIILKSVFISCKLKNKQAIELGAEVQEDLFLRLFQQTI